MSLCFGLAATLAGHSQKSLNYPKGGVGAITPKSVQAGLSVTSIAAGGWRSLALVSDGTVWEWGFDSQPYWSEAAPIQVSGLSGIVAIDGAASYSLAVKDDGTVWAWGGGWGDGWLQSQAAPVQLAGLSGIRKVSGGGNHALALNGDGTVWAWGYNTQGELGNGTTSNSYTDLYTPVPVLGLTGVVAIAAGQQHSLALKSDGTVWAWGSNIDGQLGDGTTAQAVLPVQVATLTDVVAVAAGDLHSLALKRDGTVWTWGLVPGPTATPWLTAVPVAGLTGVAAIAASGYASLAAKEDGTVWQWGTQWGEESPSSPPSDPNIPVEVAGMAGADRVAIGMGHCLALKSDGTIWAWGWNEYGQLGNGTTARRSTRIQVIGLDNVAQVAGGAAHSLAVKHDGTVWAWGRNQFGELGDGTTTNRSMPVQVNKLSNVMGVAAGYYHSLALKSDGTVWAWGSNWLGQLGDGTTVNRLTPVPVSGVNDVVAIAAGGTHNLALKRDGTVWAWGMDGTASSAIPAQVSGVSDVAAIAADIDHSLALKQDGSVWTWGWIGWVDGTSRYQLTPAEVDGLSGVVAATWASGDGLAVTQEGSVWEWGIPERGIQWTPTQVDGLNGVVALAGGDAYEYFCGNCGQRLALKSDGTVWAWGDNEDGQLGDGTIQDGAEPARMTPLQVGGLAGVVAIGAGDLHSLAVKADGTVWTWGNNEYGQLGDGMALETPVLVVPPGSPHLKLAMSHEGDFPAGGRGTYLLTITNAGRNPTVGAVTLTDSLPPGLTYYAATGTGWACAAPDQIVTCTNQGPVIATASSTLTITVDVGPAAWPGVTNFAVVSNESDLDISNHAVCDATVVSQVR